MSNFMPTDPKWRNGFNAGLQVRRNMKQIGGGGTPGGGTITGNGTGFVYVYNNKRKTAKVGGSCVWHYCANNHYLERGDILSEYASYFAPTNIQYETGTFSATDSNRDSYTMHGIKLLFKSGITMLVGFEEILHTEHLVTINGEKVECPYTGFIWSCANRAVIYDASGNLLWQASNKGANMPSSLGTGGSWYYNGNDIKSNMMVEFYDGFMTLHGDPEYANKKTTLTLYDLPTCTGIGYMSKNVTFYDPNGGTATYTNATTCYNSSADSSHMPYYLNCFVNPETYPNAEKYKLYLTKDKNGEVVHNTYVPMSYLKHDIIFNIYEPISGKAYSCVKLCNNAMQIIGEAQPPVLQDNNNILASFMVTEGG